MIGELFNAVVDEVTGNDPENRRIGALPYLFAKASMGSAFVNRGMAPSAPVMRPGM